MRKKINYKFLFSVPLTILIVLVTGHVAWIIMEMNELSQQSYQVGETGYKVLYNVARMEKLVLGMETGVRGYLLTGDKNFLESYHQSEQDLRYRIEKLSSLLDKDTAVYREFQNVCSDVDNWINVYAVSEISLRQKNELQDVSIQEQSNEKTLMDNIRIHIDKLEGLIEQNSSQQVRMMKLLHRRVMIEVCSSTLILLLIILLLVMVINNRTRTLENTNKVLVDKERRLEIAVRELQEASRLKSEFLANMSHELRTPLNASIGFAQVLQKQYYGSLTDKQSNYVNYIRNSGQHLLSLINDILDISKIEAGKMDLIFSQFPLRELLENSISMFKEKAFNHRIELHLEISDDIKEIMVDERKLKQIVYNLLSNAVKFTPNGGMVRVSARHKYDKQVNHIEISVSDTGIGIPVSEQERIFEPFTQVDGSYTRNHQGTGLGLSLVKRLVELHGGQVWVESTGEGKGSTFYFTLPKK